MLHLIISSKYFGQSETPMYYSSIGLIALLIHFIINYNVLKKSSLVSTIPASLAYKRFLHSVMWYYITDVIWEPLYAFKLTQLVFIETEIYFAVIALSVLLWMQYVTTYLHAKSKMLIFTKISGTLFMAFQLIVLIVNCFTPIAFWFDDDTIYHTGIGRELNLILQALMFFVISCRMLFLAIRAKGEMKHRLRAIGLFGVIMAVFVILQIFHPFMPFYSIGYMLGTCLLHTFVLEDEKEKNRQKIEKLLYVEKIQEAELGSARQMAFTDPMTSVKNKLAYMEDVDSINHRIESGHLQNFAVAVFDVNDLKLINDTKGHDEGDTYIKTACSIICKQFKHSPVYRIGGDEFVAFLSGEDFENREELISSFNQIIEKNRAEGAAVIACGLSEFNAGTDKTFQQIFERADKQMYENKSRLKNR